MNENRRRIIRNTLDKIERVVDLIEVENPLSLTFLIDIRDTVDSLLEEERDSFDNLSEALQQSPNGEASQEAIEQLEGALELLEDCVAHSQEYEEFCIQQFEVFEAQYPVIIEYLESI